MPPAAVRGCDRFDLPLAPWTGTTSRPAIRRRGTGGDHPPSCTTAKTTRSAQSSPVRSWLRAEPRLQKWLRDQGDRTAKHAESSGTAMVTACSAAGPRSALVVLAVERCQAGQGRCRRCARCWPRRCTPWGAVREVSCGGMRGRDGGVELCAPGSGTASPLSGHVHTRWPGVAPDAAPAAARTASGEGKKDTA